MKSFEVPKFLITSESDLEVSEPEDFVGNLSPEQKMVLGRNRKEQEQPIQAIKETYFQISSAKRQTWKRNENG